MIVSNFQILFISFLAIINFIHFTVFVYIFFLIVYHSSITIYCWVCIYIVVSFFWFCRGWLLCMGNMHAYNFMFLGDIFYHLQICIVIIIFGNYHILVFENSKKLKYGKMTHKNGPHIQNRFLKIKSWNCLK
jgi:hypothetical protein